uniref:Uncharacterized protein n=1 Tax=Glossina pallidipes TaxID=7398 RepID=A0A1A9ZZS6_GLOPL
MQKIADIITKQTLRVKRLVFIPKTEEVLTEEHGKFQQCRLIIIAIAIIYQKMKFPERNNAISRKSRRKKKKEKLIQSDGIDRKLYQQYCPLPSIVRHYQMHMDVNLPRVYDLASEELNRYYFLGFYIKFTALSAGPLT